MNRAIRYIAFTSIIAVVVWSAACNSGASSGTSPDTGKTIKSGPAGNNLTVTVSNADGVVRKGKQNLTIVFSDAAGKPVDVGAASVNFFMPAMGSMSAMNNPVTLTTTATPGIYSGSVNLDMTGEWQAQITYEGPAGKGKATLPISEQ